MFSILRNITSVLGVLLILSLPLAPSLVFGLNSSSFEMLELLDTGSENEEEEEKKMHGESMIISDQFQEISFSPLVHEPLIRASPSLEIHCPPPDFL